MVGGYRAGVSPLGGLLLNIVRSHVAVQSVRRGYTVIPVTVSFRHQLSLSNLDSASDVTEDSGSSMGLLMYVSDAF
jgi:hypothetical protein